jgi:ElaB/YqjD/DUF883 family membrane-anchored ribosome-binding protein
MDISYLLRDGVDEAEDLVRDVPLCSVGQEVKGVHEALGVLVTLELC